MVFIKLFIRGDALDQTVVSPWFDQNSVCFYPKDEVLKNGETRKKDLLYVTAECHEADAQNAIQDFISDLGKMDAVLKQLTAENEVAIWISAYPDDEQFGFTLSSYILKELSDRNISLMLDVSFFQELYNA